MHHFDKLVFLEDLRLPHGCQAHQIPFNVVKVHMALSQHVPTRVDVTLNEKREHELIQTLHFLLC